MPPENDLFTIPLSRFSAVSKSKINALIPLSTKITDAGFGDFKDGLKRLTSLQDFSLDIYE